MQEGPHPAASNAHATRTQRGLYSRRPEARGIVHSARWLSCRAPFDHLCLLPLLLLVQCILPQYGGGIEPDLCAGRRWHGVHLAGLQRQLSRQLLLSLQAVLCSKNHHGTPGCSSCHWPRFSLQACLAGDASTRKVMVAGLQRQPCCCKMQVRGHAAPALGELCSRRIH